MHVHVHCNTKWLHKCYNYIYTHDYTYTLNKAIPRAIYQLIATYKIIHKLLLKCTTYSTQSYDFPWFTSYSCHKS